MISVLARVYSVAMSALFLLLCKTHLPKTTLSASVRASQFNGVLQNAVWIFGSESQRMTSSDIYLAVKIQQAKVWNKTLAYELRYELTHTSAHTSRTCHKPSSARQVKVENVAVCSVFRLIMCIKLLKKKEALPHEYLWPDRRGCGRWWCVHTGRRVAPAPSGS